MNRRKIIIKPPFIRLDQLLKLAGIAGSGGEAKFLILGGQVIVNDMICTMRGKKIKDGDRVFINEDECLMICYEAD